MCVAHNPATDKFFHYFCIILCWHLRTPSEELMFLALGLVEGATAAAGTKTTAMGE
jgi:hypothetical protein